MRRRAIAETYWAWVHVDRRFLFALHRARDTGRKEESNGGACADSLSTPGLLLVSVSACLCAYSPLNQQVLPVASWLGTQATNPASPSVEGNTVPAFKIHLKKSINRDG